MGTKAPEGTNDYDVVGYGGPNPPDGVHTYRFERSVLESRLDIPVEIDAEGLDHATDGLVIEQAALAGTYPPAA